MRNKILTVATQSGPGRVALDVPTVQTNGTALLFHGAGGDMNAAVLLAVRDALLGAGWRVARYDQPYRVAGRRLPPLPARLDEAALAAVEAVREGPLLLMGKSSGARVACRIATAAGAKGAVALGFPLHPPGRPEKTRAAELNAAGVPVLVLQGERDTFGSPDEVRAVAGRGVEVCPIEGGDHSFGARRADGRTTAECVAEVAALAAGFAQART